MLKDSVSIILLALNEEENLSPSFDTILNEVNNTFGNYEIIIVNDGSNANRDFIMELFLIKLIHSLPLIKLRVMNRRPYL